MAEKHITLTDLDADKFGNKSSRMRLSTPDLPYILTARIRLPAWATTGNVSVTANPSGDMDLDLETNFGYKLFEMSCPLTSAVHELEVRELGNEYKHIKWQAFLETTDKGTFAVFQRIVPELSLAKTTPKRYSTGWG